MSLGRWFGVIVAKIKCGTGYGTAVISGVQVFGATNDYVWKPAAVCGYTSDLSANGLEAQRLTLRYRREGSAFMAGSNHNLCGSERSPVTGLNDPVVVCPPQRIGLESENRADERVLNQRFARTGRL